MIETISASLFIAFISGMAILSINHFSVYDSIHNKISKWMTYLFSLAFSFYIGCLYLSFKLVSDSSCSTMPTDSPLYPVANTLFILTGVYFFLFIYLEIIHSIGKKIEINKNQKIK